MLVSFDIILFVNPFMRLVYFGLKWEINSTTMNSFWPDRNIVTF